MTGTHLYLYGDCLFRVDDGVQEPKFGSVLLARHMAVRPDDAVLDLGTGTGFLAVLAARSGAAVVATDLVPVCAASAAANATLNGVGGRVRVLVGDLYEPVRGERFTLIVANPPQMPTPPGREGEDPRALADNAGPDGWALLDRIIAGAPAHLRPGGRLAFTLFGFLGPEEAFRKVRAAGLLAAVRARERQPFPRLAFERLDYLRDLDREKSIVREGGRLYCDRLVIEGVLA